MPTWPLGHGYRSTMAQTTDLWMLLWRLHTKVASFFGCADTSIDANSIASQPHLSHTASRVCLYTTLTGAPNFTSLIHIYFMSLTHCMSIPPKLLYVCKKVQHLSRKIKVPLPKYLISDSLDLHSTECSIEARTFYPQAWRPWRGAEGTRSIITF